MRVLGIDPGMRIMGWAVLDQSTAGVIKYIAGGSVHTAQDDAVARRLYKIFHSLDQIIQELKPNYAAIEEVFVNSNAKSSLALGFARGAILSSLGKNDITTYEFAPNRIKKTIVGNGKADKNQVMKMLSLVIPGVEFKSVDEADAVAIAYTGIIYKSSVYTKSHIK
ncbi:MAG: crossover junction endodeoxyribonuclease RuvC [Rickettsiaceae bacterium]|nr:crossover junction endodeoxyribonuclease RuvC [Rickettsiaceae bacterium]